MPNFSSFVPIREIRVSNDQLPIPQNNARPLRFSRSSPLGLGHVHGLHGFGHHYSLSDADSDQGLSAAPGPGRGAVSSGFDWILGIGGAFLPPDRVDDHPGLPLCLVPKMKVREPAIASRTLYLTHYLKN